MRFFPFINNAPLHSTHKKIHTRVKTFMGLESIT